MASNFNPRARSDDARARPQMHESSSVFPIGPHAVYDPVHDSYDVREPTSRPPAHERPLNEGYHQPPSVYTAGGNGRSMPNASLPPLRTYIHDAPQGFGRGTGHPFDSHSQPYSGQGLDRRFSPLDNSPIEHITSPVASMPPRFPGSFRPGEGSPESPGALPSLVIPPESQSPQSPLTAEGRQSKRIVMACHQW